MENPTPYQIAVEKTNKDMALVQELMSKIENKSTAYNLLRGLEYKFNFFAIIVSVDDIQEYMQETLGVDWFIRRGYTQENGEELEEVPIITPSMADELSLDLHPWRTIEEDSYDHIRAQFIDTVESLFPIKS